MLSVFDRIRNAFSQSESLSKVELFKNATIPNTPSNRALFQILVENGKLIKIGDRRTARYRLPIVFHVFTPPKEGVYMFKQIGDGNITFQFEQEEPIVFVSYDEYVNFILRRFNG